MGVHAMLGGVFQAAAGFRQTCLMARLRRSLKYCGPNVNVVSPEKVENPRCISLGETVWIMDHTSLRAGTEYWWTGQTFNPELTIDDFTFVNRFGLISCQNRIAIGKKVIIADGVYIADYTHGYADTTKSITENPMEIYGTVRIGDGSWIGAHACVFGDLTIGKHCIVGANAVLSKSLPDYSIAVGAPARIVKRFDPQLKEWRKTRPDGSFVEG
jgi:acetyltransferase-like isoleucine patch superfamily enzyme